MSRRRLDAWKEIAQYLGRDVTTVRRWERREGLPVHRHLHDKLGSVYAYTDEIDAWSARRSIQAPPVEDPRPDAEPSAPVTRPSEATPPLPVTPVRRATRSPVWRFVFATAGLAAIVAATSSLWTPRPRARSNPAFKVALAPPPGTVVESLAISPDGEQAAFTAGGADGVRLWIRRFDSTAAEPLAGTEGATHPFWSADGQQVGFFTGGWLKRVALSTREVHDIAAAPNGHGGAWNDRGDIVFAANGNAPLSHVSASGGPVTTLTVLGTAFKEGHAWPEFLPDGRHFLYTDYTSNQSRFGIYVADLDTKVSKRLLGVYSSAAYSRDGYLLFARDSLMAQPFDLTRLEPDGAARPIADHVRRRYDLGHKADFSVSHTCVVAVRSAGVDQNRLAWIDRTGTETRALSEPSWYSNPTLSPDGTKVLTTVAFDTPSDNLWMFDREGGAPRRFTFGKGTDSGPVWSPGSDRVIFSGPHGLFEKIVDGGNAVPALPAKFWQHPESWSRDYLTFMTINRTTKADVWAWKLSDTREPFPILTTAAQEGQSQISPDGRFLAYVSDESGRFEVYVQSFPTPTDRWQVSSGGGADPRWRGDGQELFYIGTDRRMMAVRTMLRPKFDAVRTTPLFDTQLDDIWIGDTRNHYDVTSDGQYFIVITPKTDRRQSPFTLLGNWQRTFDR